jgi:hypothetical protein
MKSYLLNSYTAPQAESEIYRQCGARLGGRAECGRRELLHRAGRPCAGRDHRFGQKWFLRDGVDRLSDSTRSTAIIRAARAGCGSKTGG